MSVHSTLSRCLVVLVLLAPITALHAQGSATLSFVVNEPSNLVAGEQTIINALVSVGHTVVLHDDNGISSDATAGSDAVLIGSTVNPVLVQAWFHDDLRPVMVMRNDLYPIMGLTGLQADVDFGVAFGQTQLDLLANGTSIGTGLPAGPTAITVTDLTGYGWGVPAASAHVVATLIGDPSRAAIFVYDQGAVLADNGVALGKRVGFYPRPNTPLAWTAEAYQLFEQTIEWMLTTTPAPPGILVQPTSQSVVDGAVATFSVAASGVPAPSFQWQRDGVDLPGETTSTLTFVATQADVGYYSVVVTNSQGTTTSAAAALRIVEARTFSLVVRSPGSLSLGDQQIVAKLESMGHTVVLHDDTGITLGATAGSDAVLISPTVGPAQVGTTFRNDVRPVVVLMFDVFDNMAMTGPQVDVDYALAFAQTHIELLDNATSIGEGLPPGPTLATLTPRDYAWGVPAPTSHVIATLFGDGGRAAIFAYDQGAVLADNSVALGKRVGFFVGVNWAGASLLLFEQTIEWLFGDDAPQLTLPVITTQPVDDVVTDGGTASFSVVATGDPSPTYRWQYNGIDLPGETSSVLTFTATLFDGGNYRVVVSNTQGSVTSDTATLTVLNANDPPFFTSVPPTTATEGVLYTYAVAGADPDDAFGDTLSFEGVEVPAWLTLNDNGDGTALLAGTPGDLDFGAHTVRLRIRDSGGLTDIQVFTITVIATNGDPRFTSVPATSIDEGSLYTYVITVANPDAGETVTISAVTRPAWLSFVDNGNGTASLRGTPRQAEVGDYLIELEAVDEGGASDTQTYTLTVINVEFGAVFTSRPVTGITEGQAYSYLIVASDADGDPVTLSNGTVPTWLTFTDNGDGTGELLGFPAGAQIGMHSVELHARDASGAAVASQLFTIVVNAAADGPVVVINGNSQVVIRRGEQFLDPGATASDPQDGDLTGDIIVSNPVDRYTLGSYTVTYSVRDTAGNLSQAQRTVVVQEQTNLGGGGALGLAELLALLSLAAWLRGSGLRPRSRMFVGATSRRDFSRPEAAPTPEHWPITH